MPNPTALQNYSPLFGRPGWTYVTVQRQPRIGPQPKLAVGAGGMPVSGNVQLPGYMAYNTYQPQGMEYDPRLNLNRKQNIPRQIRAADDGRGMVGTYQPHPVNRSDYMRYQNRSARMWEEMTFGPDFRNLILWKQVEKYRVQSTTISAAPLPQSNYFLGYVTNPQVAADLGGNALGYMGSS